MYYHVLCCYRVKYDRSSRRLVKNVMEVKIPATLNLERHIKHGHGKYIFRAATIHKGRTPTSGHYTAVQRHKLELVEYDDTKVT
jgi:ubiquitin C-terminal hydrolase